MKHQTELEATISALRQETDQIRAQQAIGLLYTTNGTGIDLHSDTLFHDMMEQSVEHPCIDNYLIAAIPDVSDPAHSQAFLSSLVLTIDNVPAARPSAA